MTIYSSSFDFMLSFSFFAIFNPTRSLVEFFQFRNLSTVSAVILLW